MQKPIIGIIAVVDNELNTRVQNTYIDVIEKAGGVPVLLPYVKNDGSIDAFARLCDGFLFTGGVDVDPARYGEQKKAFCGEIQLFRDELEFRAFEKIYSLNKPVMAICRGAQLVNVALGGALYQDIPSEIQTDILHNQTEPKDSPSHSVKILDGAPLSTLISKNVMKANSFHHQAIKRLGKGLEVMALADDGITEAVYSVEMRYLRAYQWHPELLINTDSDNFLLFMDFIKACT